MNLAIDLGVHHIGVLQTLNTFQRSCSTMANLRVLQTLGKGVYHATCRNFTAEGTYNIAVYAMDKN
jgi:hypothetical protein